MKVCLSSRQQHEYLLKADEIRVSARDHKAIPELAEKYPEAEWIDVSFDRIAEDNNVREVP